MKPTSTVGLLESLTATSEAARVPAEQDTVAPPAWAVVGAIVDYTPPNWPASAMVTSARIIAAPFRLRGPGWVAHLDKVRGWIAVEALRPAGGTGRG